jgi:hypothetical protein
MAEWAEYQLIFNDILTRLSAHLARQAKVDKKRLDAQVRDAPETVAAPVSAPGGKQALRSQYAMQRFGGRIQALMDAKPGGNGEFDSQSR